MRWTDNQKMALVYVSTTIGLVFAIPIAVGALPLACIVIPTLLACVNCSVLLFKTRTITTISV